MQLRLSSSILATIALAGCALHPSPASAPAAASATPNNSSAASERTAVAPAVPAAAATAAPEATADSSSHAGVIPAGGPVGETTPISKTEVSRRAIEVFGDSLILLDAPVLDSSVVEPSWDIDVRSYETQDRVAHYVSQFSGRSRKAIAESLERGSRYEPMIRAKMKAGGLPEDMYYLALVESGYNPNAYSRAAAVGMWQFMTSTARGMGMRVDWWVDERRDPVRSTKAAVQFIRGLRDQFGSLYLAAAAYNGGPGRVARGLAKYADDVDTTSQREDAFFVLAEKDYLRNETREYVPQLIAAALVAKDPVRYGLEFHPRAAFAYDSVRVPAKTPLAAVAKAAGTTVAAVRDLNPHLLRGMTPPGASSLVRVPVGAAAAFDSGFKSLSKDERIATRTIETKKGQYPDNLAHAYGIRVSALEGFNPRLRLLKPSGKLVPGQTLVLPTPAVASAALDIPDPGIEKYSSSTKRIKVHTVKRGESVRQIAKRYDTTPERIMKLNGLRKPLIFAGQSLIVSGSPSTKAGKSAERGGTGHTAKASRGGKSSKAVASVKSKKKPAVKPKPASKGAEKHSGAGSKAGARTRSSNQKSVKKSSSAN
jgi:membrane-bound lytic murein transglycosylase D